MENQKIIKQESQTNTFQTYSPEVNGAAIILAQKGKSLVQCREGESFTLASARKQASLEKAELIILQMMAILVKQMNIKTSKEALEAIAEDVYEIGYFLRVEELAYFFKELRKGTYGSMYENLNSEKVCRALNKFLLDRSNYFERKSMGVHHENAERPEPRVNETAKFREVHKQMIAKHAIEKGK